MALQQEKNEVLHKEITGQIDIKKNSPFMLIVITLFLWLAGKQQRKRKIINKII